MTSARCGSDTWAPRVGPAADFSKSRNPVRHRAGTRKPLKPLQKSIFVNVLQFFAWLEPGPTMYTLLLPLTALLAGVALLLTGSGLLGTLLAVRGSPAGFGDQALGLVMSAYFRSEEHTSELQSR